ncbi:MAG: tyrosine-type recombinase/integrase [Thermoprotei archaeon]|nr:tyrosine-type recombinase/integrase [Thermoprotei archaeon]
MVDPKTINLKSIDNETRYRIFMYLWNKGIRSRALGYSPTLLNRVKNRRLRVSDRLLARLLEYLTIDEFASLISGKEPEVKGIREAKDLSEAILQIDQIVAHLKDIIKKYPSLSSYAYQRLSDVLNKASVSVIVTEDMIKKFEKLISDRARKTREDHLRYLRKALKNLNFELNSDRLQEYIMELREESEHIARHISKALKLFIKLVLKDPVLYNSFKVVRPKELSLKEPLTLEQVREIARRIGHLGAKAYFVMLAETGLRPGEVLRLTLDQIDLEERLVKVIREGKTKRAYVSFFSEKTKEFLAKEYLPYREQFVNQYAAALKNLGFSEEFINEWKKRLFPFADYVLRREIYMASEKVLGRQIRLYDLRSFFASYMSLKGVPGQIIDILQGRVPPKEFEVLQRHYLAISIKELREIYDKAGLVVLG